VRDLDADSKIRLVRPLLSWARRSDTEDYCRSRRIHFRVDEMNHDTKFTRVKVRKQLLPLMQSFNNKIVEALARTAALLREDAAALSDEASKLLSLASKVPESQNEETNLPPLNVKVLANASVAIRRRALRQWLSLARGDLRRLEMVHLLGVEGLLEGTRSGRVAELPDGTRVVRKRGWLEVSVKEVEKGTNDL
jgi:tRNA(Ile)-lysidine synthase